MITEYELSQIEEIEKWKNRPPDAVSQFADAILMPATLALSAIIPEKAMMGALHVGDNFGRFLSRFQSIRKLANIDRYEQLLKKELGFCDRIAEREQGWSMGIAAVEGGITGALGLPGIAVDVPAIVSFALRSIHLMGLSYGFELKSKEDQDMTFAILSASGANSLKEKLAALTALRMIQATVTRESFKKMAEKAVQNAMAHQAVILTVKQLAKQLQINLTKRKILQAVPFAGAGIGATVNAWYISDVCWAARRAFQERWLRTNGHWPTSAR